MLPPIPPFLALAPFQPEGGASADASADAAREEAREEARRAVADATREAASAQVPSPDASVRTEEIARAAAEEAARAAAESADGRTREAGRDEEGESPLAAVRESLGALGEGLRAATEKAEEAAAGVLSHDSALADMAAEMGRAAGAIGRLEAAIQAAVDDRDAQIRRLRERVDELEEEDAPGEVATSPGGGEDPEDDGGEDEARGDALFAYKVVVSGGEVWCFVPKAGRSGDSSGVGEWHGGAFGGPHVGSSNQPLAPETAGPYSESILEGVSAGLLPIADRSFSWAHYGWLSLGSLEERTDGMAAERVVVATFLVPRDPPEEERDDDTEVEGASLQSVELMEISAWRSWCKESWKQFDPAGSDPVQRKVPIALVANGHVTQLTMTPYISLGGGTGESWRPDSECGKFLSLDPPNEHACPDYETEEYQDTEQREVGKDLNGNPIMRDVTVTKTRVKTDPQTGEPIQKTDGSGNPMFLAPKHQVHNFETGDDGAELQPVDEDGYPKDLVACRVKKAGGGYELMWRRLPPYKEPCPPPDVTASVRYASGDDTVYLDITVTPYVKNPSTGECEQGTPTVTTVPIPSERVQIDCDCRDGCSPEVTVVPANPNPLTNGNGPTLAATVTIVNKTRDANGDCVSGSPMVFSVYNGKDGKDGCSPVVNVIALNPNPPTQKGHATKAGTIEVTPCNGAKQTLDVYNGQDGEDGEDGRDGCSPVVTPGAGHTDADGRVLACKIQGRKLGANGCENDGNEIEVFNGKDATVCGSFYGFAGVKFESGVLKYGKQLYEFQLDNGCYKPVATGSVVWDTVSGLTFQPCPN